MKLPRRQFLHLAAGAAALPAVSRLAWAQTYPSQPVRIIVGFAAGGPNDILARLIGQWLSERLGQPFVIENRPGAGSNIATEAVVHAPPDGYTLLLVGSPNAINATLYDKLNFNFIRDIAPVASFMRGALCHGGTPVGSGQDASGVHRLCQGKSGQALIRFRRRRRDHPHHAGELFKMMAGVEMVHVPYRGVAPALTDLLGGQVQVLFANPAPVDSIHQGRQAARSRDNHRDALGGAARHPDRGRVRPGLRGELDFGFGAPRNTPAEIIDKLNKEINAGLADPKIKARLADLDGMVLIGSPADFGKLIAEETEKWGKVIRAANIKPE